MSKRGMSCNGCGGPIDHDWITTARRCTRCIYATRQRYRTRLKAARPSKPTYDAGLDHFAWRLRTRFGMTPLDYECMKVEQGGGCAICGGATSNGKRLAVDHDHETGVVRGLLCDVHNRGLGLFQDNPEVLRCAADYLEKAISRT